MRYFPLVLIIASGCSLGNLNFREADTDTGDTDVTETDTDTDADSDADSDADTDADSDADSDTDTDTDTGGGDYVVIDVYGDEVDTVSSCSTIDWEDLCSDLGGTCAWQELPAGTREFWAHIESVEDIDAEAPANWIGWTDSLHMEGDDAAKVCGVVYMDGDVDAVRQNATSCPDENSFEDEPWGEDAIAAGCGWTAEGQTDDEASLRHDAGAICADGDIARTQADAWSWTGDNAGTGSHAISVCDDSFDLDDLDNE